MTDQPLTTANITIDPELCKRLDKHLYSNQPEYSNYPVEKAMLYRRELMDYIRTYNAELADSLAKHPHGLYYLYCFAQRVCQDHAKHECERRHANIQSARTQLKAWDK